MIDTSDIFQTIKNSGIESFYITKFGAAYLGDSNDVLKSIPSNSISLIVISPPFALRKKKKYGNEPPDKYVDWFSPFAEEAFRILKNDGSFVIEIGGAWLPKLPIRSIYQYELLIHLVKNIGFNLAQEFYWYNPAKMPGPAQWVNIERIRCTDAISNIWWLSKTQHPNANNKRVLVPYSKSMKRLLKRGYNKGARPSGHIVSDKWGIDHGGAIPKNILNVSNTSSNDYYQRNCRERGITIHPARFPEDIPDFFIRFLTENDDDVVLDFFAGSNMTGYVAEKLKRKWIAIEKDQDYLVGSKIRFEEL